MSYKFLDIASTPSVRAAQAANGSREMWERFKGRRTFDRFTDEEVAFIAARDNFYMATVSESGWPYVQHRGGPPGFLKVLDEKTIGFADFRGNLQYISVGNIAADDRAALILVDYPNRARLKILAHVEVRNIEDDTELAARLALPGYKGKLERVSCCTLRRLIGTAHSTSCRASRSRRSRLHFRRYGAALPNLRPRIRRCARKRTVMPDRAALCIPLATA